MAEQVGKFLTELPELETPTDGDLMYIVDDETASKKVTMANLKRVLGGNVTGTVEGASVSFSDGADGIPMEECEVTIVPTQDLHGYSKPWAGGAGKNKCFNALGNVQSENAYLYPQGDGLAITINNSTRTAYAKVAQNTDIIFSCEENPQRYIAYGLDAYPDVNVLCHSLAVTQLATNQYKFNSGAYEYIAFYYCNDVQNIPDDVMIEQNTQATTFEPYSNICPISGHSSVTVTVASTSGGSGDDTTVSLGRTVYGGTLDVTTGELKVTHACIDLGNYNWANEDATLSGLARIPLDEVRTLGAIYNQTPICSNYEGKTPKGYSQFSYGEIAFSNSEQYPLMRVRDANLSSMTDAQIKAYMSGVTFCYDLATPQTFNLTPTQVETLLGQNYVSHDGGGNIKVVYIRDLDIVINDLIDRVTALENE